MSQSMQKQSRYKREQAQKETSDMMSQSQIRSPAKRFTDGQECVKGMNGMPGITYMCLAIP